jgi:hypothetical protein
MKGAIKMEAQGLKTGNREKFTVEEKPTGVAGSIGPKERKPLERGKGVAIARAAAALAFTGGYLFYRAKMGHRDFFEAMGMRRIAGSKN